MHSRSLVILPVRVTVPAFPAQMPQFVAFRIVGATKVFVLLILPPLLLVPCDNILGLNFDHIE